MAIRKNHPVQKIDAAVEAATDPIYGSLESRRARARGMTPGQRKKAEADRKRNKKTYDLPEDLERWVVDEAQRLSVPQSQVVAICIMEARCALEQDVWDWEDYEKVPSRSPRYEWVFSDLRQR